MDVNDVKTISDAIECLDKHKEKWAISIAVDCGDYDTAVEYVFDLVLEAARRADDGRIETLFLREHTESYQ